LFGLHFWSEGSAAGQVKEKLGKERPGGMGAWEKNRGGGNEGYR